MGAPSTTLFIHTRAREGRGAARPRAAAGRRRAICSFFSLTSGLPGRRWSAARYGVAVRNTRSQKCGHPPPPRFHSDISGWTLSLGGWLPPAGRCRQIPATMVPAPAELSDRRGRRRNDGRAAGEAADARGGRRLAPTPDQPPDCATAAVWAAQRTAGPLSTGFVTPPFVAPRYHSEDQRNGCPR
jgi:hypothetical protein